MPSPPKPTTTKPTTPASRSSIDLPASLARLRAGHLPTRAERRLTEEAGRAGGAGRLFTSDLSVNELLVAREVGLTPISQVMGSSIYHIGRIADYKGQTGEIESISAAHREARSLALRRLNLEATFVDADVVIGVRLGERLITKGAHGKGGDDGDEVIEFTVVGTAARAPWLARPRGEPVLTDLCGQDLWALARDGWAPCGMVFDFCRYHVFHVLGSGRASFSVGAEITGATQGVDAARTLVADRVKAQAARTGAELVVGSDIKVDVHEVPCGWRGCELNDLDIDVTWYGTGIKRMANAAQASADTEHKIPPLVLGMMPLGRRKRADVLEGMESESEELAKEAKEEEERAAEGSEGGGEGE